MRIRSIFIGSSCGLVTAMVIFTASLSVAAQTSPHPLIDANEMMQLHQMSGNLLAQGSNRELAGKPPLRSFILEELNLAHAVRAEINGQIIETSRVWRLTITGGPFPIRAVPAMVWLDDRAAGDAAASPDLSRLSVIIFNKMLLREGATISISYGRNDPVRVELREKLTLKSSK